MWSDAADLANGDPRRFGRATLLPAAWAEPAEAAALTAPASDLRAEGETGPPLRLQYHDIRTDAAGMILPWSHDDPARAYDHVVAPRLGLLAADGEVPERRAVLPPAPGLEARARPARPRRRPDLDGPRLLEPAARLPGRPGGRREHAAAGRLLARPRDDREGRSAWPNVPFPYNTDVHSGRYDGDMVAGKGFLQPDKAGALRGRARRLSTRSPARRATWRRRVGIADTLARHARPGDADHSPWPFRVHAVTGEVFASTNGRFDYTTNWMGALRLLRRARRAWARGAWPSTTRARRARERLAAGPPREVAAVGAVLRGHQHLLGHPDQRRDRWRSTSSRTRAGWRTALPRSAASSTGRTRRSATRCGRGTASSPRTSRRPTRCRATATPRAQASLELLWAEAAGDPSRKAQAVRNLSWATYMVDTDGKNRYYRDDVWLTDGYGDYVRHYLRAMAAAPELAPRRPEPPAADELGRPLDRLRSRRDRLREVGRGLARAAQARRVGARARSRAGRCAGTRRRACSRSRPPPGGWSSAGRRVRGDDSAGQDSMTAPSSPRGPGRQGACARRASPRSRRRRPAR